MADLQTLIRTIDALSADELRVLYNHILATRIKFVETPSTSPAVPRVLGLFEHTGETWMSDDFDAELPDSFWLGEDEA
ncbi:hypothetical protein ANRL4_02859 [Anaerolineae bacterium]|nr:hypothetical protein ANRL4_02859 [Anaerolineae bacterium]